jgi:excisionase family DNA binding protein
VSNVLAYGNLHQTVAETRTHEPLFSDNRIESPFMTVEEAAKILRVSLRTVYTWFQFQEKYRIPEGLFSRPCRKILIDRQLFMNWAKTRR